MIFKLFATFGLKKWTTPGETLHITHEKTITRNATDFTYIGSTLNSSHNVFIAVFGDEARLELSAPNKNMVLEYNGENHIIRNSNELAFGPENEGGGQLRVNPNYEQIVQNAPEGVFTSDTHHNLEIDVIFLYTPGAENDKSQNRLRLIANLGIDKINNVMEFSAIPVEFRNVELASADRQYVDSGIMQTELDRLIATGDGYMERGNALRDREDADIGVLFTFIDDKDVCGKAAEILAAEENAFVVINSNCNNPLMGTVIGHEIGHIMGAHHVFRLDPSLIPFPFAHGFDNVSQGHYTIMAYPCPLNNEDMYENCTWHNQFSDPGKYFFGTNIISGTEHREDNAKAVSYHAPYIASLKGDDEEYTMKIIPDVIDPILLLPDDKTFEATGVQTFLTITQIGTATATDDRDPSPTITRSPTSNSFAIGVHIITWTATDDSGNIATGTQTITIQDTTPPVFSNIKDVMEVTTMQSTTVSYDLPTAQDIFPVTIVCTPASDSEFDIGSTVVTCTATDSSGNISSISFDVIVTFTDVTDPVLTIPEDKTFEATSIKTPLTLSQIGTATATDNSGSAIITSNVTDSYPLGDTILVYTATDAAGNTSNGTQTITVQDTIPPVISNVPADFTSDSSTVSYDLPAASDIFPVTISCDPAPNSEFIAGNNLVTCTAIDDNANSATATFNVIVNILDTPTKSASITAVNGGGNYIPFTDGMTITDNTPRFRGTSENLDEVQLLLNGVQVGVTTNVLYDGRWTKIWLNDPLDDGLYTLTVREYGVDIASFSIIIDAVQYSEPTSFAPITDNFDSLDSWSFVKTYHRPYTGYPPYNGYSFTHDTAGNPGPSGLISGNGYSAISKIHQSFGIPSNVDTLFVGVDYRAVSDSSSYNSTNARLKILDTDGVPLFSEQLIQGGTTDSGWISYTVNATEFIKDNDSIVIELSNYDYLLGNIHQKVYFDNFFARTNP